MNCEAFRRELPFLASGDTEGLEFQEHLESCKSCREELEKARRLEGLLQDTFNGLAPREDFRLRPPRRPFPWLPWTSGAAALIFAALSLFLAISLWKGDGEFPEKKNLDLARELLKAARGHIEEKKPQEALSILDALAAHAPSNEALRDEVHQLQARAHDLHENLLEQKALDMEAMEMKASRQRPAASREAIR